MFETKSERPASRRTFLKRMAASAGLALGLVGASLAVGVLGYHHLAGFGWADSLLNASMILSGMGPVGELPNDAAKVFASGYALASGLVFISVTGLLLAPLAHRGLHLFHLDEKDLEAEEEGPDAGV